MFVLHYTIFLNFLHKCTYKFFANEAHDDEMFKYAVTFSIYLRNSNTKKYDTYMAIESHV